MQKINNLQNKVFGKLTVDAMLRKNKNIYWSCTCDCGNKVEVRTDCLTRGITRSCGCLRLTNEGRRKFPKEYPKLHRAYNNMISRCYNEKNNSYKHYGGRGISVCDEWKLDHNNFVLWALQNGYSDKLTIERNDVNGNYEPSNCRWATMQEQGVNKRTNRIITFNGVSKTMSEWALIAKVNYKTLHKRLKDGWTIARAFVSQQEKTKEGK